MSDKSSEDLYLKIAVNAPMDVPLTYMQHPDGHSVCVGQSVKAPLGARKVNGVVVGHTSDAGSFKLKPIAEVQDQRHLIPEDYLKWSSWIAKYYVHPIGRVMELMFPPLLKKTGTLRKKNKAVPEDLEQSYSPKLTDEQAQCIDAIKAQKGFSVNLLHGVTGSGKTEVYLNLIAEQVAAGKSSLVLVPEISLTPQLLHRFAARFPGEVAVIHSHLTSREKTNQWWSVYDGDKKILIGARSALFCPIKNLGLIVIDEEHEPSFKQEEQLKYHARDIAIMLGRFKNIPLVLGSATPSLETWNNCLERKFNYFEMKSRVADRKMPQIDVIDMSDERENKERSLPFWISDRLHQGIAARLLKKEQSVLFLNRRGVAQTAICSSCGYVHECPNCAITLTLHAKKHLVCHYCDYAIAFSEKCPKCNELEVSSLGIGTELVESDLQKLFPDAVIARADRDEITRREEMELLIDRMESGEIDILVGTQMIAKGLDFEAVTLVGLVMADVGFNIPNFRSSERSYHLITQVCGRSGRHRDDGGEVIIQTYNPEHTSITHTVSGQLNEFYHEQLGHRKELFYPPYARLTAFRIQGLDLSKVIKTADILRLRAEELRLKYSAYEGIRVLGPAPAPLSKIKNKYRYQLLLKGPKADLMNKFIRQIMSDKSWIASRVKVIIDIDPMNMI